MSAEPDVRYRPGEDEPLSNAILEALSAAKGRDITEHECVLYDSIDTEALDGIFREESEGDVIKVEFTTHDAIVIVWGNGRITIEVQDFESDPTHS